jgi:hypothetical protein
MQVFDPNVRKLYQQQTGRQTVLIGLLLAFLFVAFVGGVGWIIGSLSEWPR